MNRPKGKAGGWDNKNKRVTCRAFCSPHLGSCLASSQNPHLRGCVLETPAKLHQQITCKRPDLSTFLRAAPEPPAHEGTAKQGKMPAPPGQAPGCPFYPCDVPGCLFCALVCIYLAKEELCCTLCFVGTRSKCSGLCSPHCSGSIKSPRKPDPRVDDRVLRTKISECCQKLNEDHLWTQYFFRVLRIDDDARGSGAAEGRVQALSHCLMSVVIDGA